MRQWFIPAILAGLFLLGIYVMYAVGEFFHCYNVLRHTPNYLVLNPDANILWECAKVHLLWPVGYSI